MLGAVLGEVGEGSNGGSFGGGTGGITPLVVGTPPRMVIGGTAEGVGLPTPTPTDIGLPVLTGWGKVWGVERKLSGIDGNPDGVLPTPTPT